MIETGPGPLTLEKLQAAVKNRNLDTVLVVFTDMQGRLQGKRVQGSHFVNEVQSGGTEACSYLLATDVEMNAAEGYELASWDKGYGNFVLRPDLTTLHVAPWHPFTAIVLCDLEWPDGSPVRPSPRQILQSQADVLAEEFNCRALAGTELEFQIFEEPYEKAWDARYASLTPANRYNIDYSIVGSGRIEALLHDIHRGASEAGVRIESLKGACNRGQYEINFRFDEVVAAADTHSLFRTAAKEVAARHQHALTFMAKYDEREGNSCHLHLNLRGFEGESPAVFAAEDGDPDAVDGRSPEFAAFVAGILATLPEFALLYAPNINSYKRFQAGTFAPTTLAWGVDNRTCALRVVGRGDSLRVENRVPGADTNVYLALAAMLAGGMYGMRNDLTLGEPLPGNAYAVDTIARIPTSLREARERFASSKVAELAFGADVVAHYVNAADVELRAFDLAVTDWERIRGFERL